MYCGVVRTAKAFGARIALEGGGGVAGWLYVAQLSHERMAFVDRVMREGDDVKVMVAGRNGRKLTLSTKALERTAGEEGTVRWADEASALAGCWLDCWSRHRYVAAHQSVPLLRKNAPAAAHYAVQICVLAVV